MLPAQDTVASPARVRACPKWAWQAAALRKSWGVSASSRPWTGDPAHRFLGMRMNKRVSEIIDLAFLGMFGRKSGRDALSTDQQTFLSNMFVDVSQNPCRKAWSNAAGVAKCLTTAASLYSYRRDSAVLPLELLCFHGWTPTVKLPESMTQKSLQHLAGEGMFLPNLASIIASLVVSGFLD